jgi:YHS domain-containing protein
MAGAGPDAGHEAVDAPHNTVIGLMTMTMLNPLRAPLLALLLLACAPWLGAATADSPNDGPFRTISEGDDKLLMLEGHDAVAYFTQNAALRGDPAIKLQYKGVTWRFASQANRAAFEREPQKYMPQFGGFCSNGINYAVPWGSGGGPNTWRIYRGKLYVFGGQASRDQFEMETELNLERAHRYWNEEVAGSNALLTRIKRLIFRVPHYKTDAQLKKEWEAMRDAGTLPVMPGAPQVVPAAP